MSLKSHRKVGVPGNVILQKSLGLIVTIHGCLYTSLRMMASRLIGLHTSSRIIGSNLGCLYSSVLCVYTSQRVIVSSLSCLYTSLRITVRLSIMTRAP